MTNYLLRAILSTAGALALRSRISVAESGHSNAQQQAHYVPGKMAKPSLMTKWGRLQARIPMVQTPTTANIKRVSPPHLSAAFGVRSWRKEEARSVHNDPKGWQHRLGVGTAVEDRAVGVSRGLVRATMRDGSGQMLSREEAPSWGPQQGGPPSWGPQQDGPRGGGWGPQQEDPLAEACDSGDNVACEILEEAALAEACDTGNVVACETLSREEEARLAEACDIGDVLACETLARREADAQSWGPPSHR